MERKLIQENTKPLRFFLDYHAHNIIGCFSTQQYLQWLLSLVVCKEEAWFGYIVF